MKSGELHGCAEVLGVTVGVVAGLLTVALCHYLGVVSLSLTSAMDDPAVLRCLMSDGDYYCWNCRSQYPCFDEAY